jgi:hypothetical protein
MTDTPSDSLFTFGKLVASVVQAICGVAGIVTLLMIPGAILAGMDMLPELLGFNDSPLVETSAISVVGIAIMLTLILAALFRFFGHMRAIIDSTKNGDPFTPANADRLKAMAWLLLAAQVLAIGVGMLRLYLANNIPGSSGGERLGISLYDLKEFVLVLVLFILARVFRHGAAMRDDLEGTV